MEISYELNQQDFTQSFRAHRNRRPFQKWVRRVVLVLVTGTSVFMLFGSILAGNTRKLLPLFLLTAVWLVIIGGLPYWMARRQFVKQPGAHGPRSVTLGEKSVQWRWNGGSSEIEWKNYVRAVEGKDHFLLYTSPACFNIIPKRSIQVEQLGEVRDVLNRNIHQQT